MCNSCGCSHGETRIDGQPAHSGLGDEQHHDHHPLHAHDAGVIEKQRDDLHFGKGPAHAHAPGLSQSRMVQIEQSILSKNDHYAEQNRASFASQQILALNLVSSPGSGKTTLLTETLNNIKDRINCAVIEGDQETANDAERIRTTGVQAVQINTGKGCHLDAHMVGHAMDSFIFNQQGLLFIENVGNLVCPAGFDLGEAHKVAILSVTEGEDKPLKYPDMFYAADLLLLNKIDLLPYLNFDVQACMDNAKKINPDIDIIQCSATSGEGMEEWYNWLETRRQAQIDTILEPLKHRLKILEACRDRRI